MPKFLVGVGLQKILGVFATQYTCLGLLTMHVHVSTVATHVHVHVYKGVLECTCVYIYIPHVIFPSYG